MKEQTQGPTYEKLPEAELDIMLSLWRYKQPVRTARILKDLEGEHKWTLSTLKALLGRLVEKQFVEWTREGRFTLYRAMMPESDYRRRETGKLLQRYYQNSAKSMIAALVREEALSGQDIAELEALLNAAKSEAEQ